MESIFVECFSVKDKNILISKGFTFLPEQSTDEKYVFFNDGKFDFSQEKINVNLHNNAYI